MNKKPATRKPTSRVKHDKIMAKRISIMATAVCVCLLAGAVWESARAATTHSFIEKATIGNQFEIESSRLALQQSQNDDVKNLAQEMVDDHTQVGQQMRKLVASKNPDATQPTVQLDAPHEKMLNKLRSAKGPAFDKLYIQDQQSAHKEAINLFKSYANDGDNQDLKAFAAQTLPQLEHHRSDVDQVAKSM